MYIVFSNFVLLGDFNVNFYNSSHRFFSNLCNILDCFSLSQVVPEPTHISPLGSTSLINPLAHALGLSVCLCVCVCVFPILAPRAIRRTNSSISDFSAIRA